MATSLYRLGRAAFTHRKRVLAAWLLLLVAFGGLAMGFGKSTDTAFTIPGVEAIEAADLLAQRLPDSGAGGASARIVFAAPQGRTVSDPAYRDGIESTIAAAASGGAVAQVSDPYRTGAISPDGRIAYATVTYRGDANAVTDADRTALRAAGDRAASAGVQVEYGGEAMNTPPGNSAAELIGVAVALVVLAVTLGSLLAAGLPLLTALFGVGTAMAAVTALTAVIDLSSIAPTLGLMIGLAVGIDYALFIVTRHKENLAAGLDPREATARAVATAGSAVVFAGATVMIALAALSVVGIPFLTSMGLVAAGVVAIAVLIALTLVPALFGFAGERFDRWPVPGMGKRQQRLSTGDSFGTRWARAITRRPLPVLLVAIIGTGVLALPALGLQLGLPDDGTKAADTTQRHAYDLLAEGFGPGFNGPLTLVIDAADGGNLDAASSEITSAIWNTADVAAVVPMPASSDTGLVTVIPHSGPSTEETKNLVGQIRDLRGAIEDSTGTRVLVTGNTATGIDISQKLASALPIFLAVVVGLSFVLLMIAFRSVLVPLKATLGFLLSLAVTFGALVAVFQWGWGAELLGIDTTGPIISFLPVLLIGLLFGLAMDYEVFLVSRMREDYTHGATPDEAVIGGFRHGARVVTAAALIMGSVFAGFILGHDTTIKSIGFALAIGVLVDAFVVRMTIVPAVMALLGHRAWQLPAWLDRILPNVDIEGAGLETEARADTVDRPELAHSR
ncbi:MMPL family transporter [Nocardia aurea]|uniref:MMPL family transporter n=1 Tax=Nocardia aurea TaxID=2144174 RepID=A0ABV3FRI1_9NOCA